MMRIETALAGVSRLFLDTAPVIYFVERNPLFVDRVDPIFERFESEITPVVGSVTVAECLVGALQMSLREIVGAKNPLLGGVEVGYAPTATNVICHKSSLSP
jgi:hypothetical protein